MKNGNILNIKQHFHVGVVLSLILFVVFGAINLFAQTAMVTNNFVHYPSTNVPNNYQCVIAPTDYPASTTLPDNRSFLTTPVNNTYNTNTTSIDPWVNSALIEFDNVFPNDSTEPLYPNHCLSLCAEVTCSNPVRKVEMSSSDGTSNIITSMASGDFPIQTILFDIFKYQAGSNPYNADTTPPVRTIAMYPAQGSGIDNVCHGVPTCCDTPQKDNAIFPNLPSNNPSCTDLPEYEKSCCDVCTWSDEGSCGIKAGACEGQTSGATCDDDYCIWNQLCNDKVDTICKDKTSSTECYDDNNCTWQAASCHTLTYDGCEAHDTQAECLQAINDGYPCSWFGNPSMGVPYKCSYNSMACGLSTPCGIGTSNIGTYCEEIPQGCYNKVGTCLNNTACDLDYCDETGSSCSTRTASTSSCIGASSSSCNSTFCKWSASGVATCDTTLPSGATPSNQNTCKASATNNPCLGIAELFPSKEACVAGITTLHFCTPWDGSYEIDGEFGKSNGQFGYRTTIKTNYPGDGISVTSDLSIEHMIVYPGDTQIPIQVDVTNVHSVRSSPTLAGKTPAVTTAPYKIRYRLSKDATTSVYIIDPEELPTSDNYVHRKLVEGKPRDGEGFQGGVQSDIVVTNEESWDGRDDYGRLLPYGNYMISIQASTRDEWSGNVEQDLSRAVTRQLSLDPLKITDIAVTGLTKESTAYAKIDYLLTEAATVHLEIYTPGTTFEDLNICNVGTGYPTCTNGYMTNAGGAQGTPVIALDSTGSRPTGMRVASYIEQKARRVGVNSKWDGMCWDEVNCGSSMTGAGASATTWSGYSYGGALPDGDYVYLLWAESPYGSTSGQAAGTFDPANSTITVNGVDWDGVKTHMIYNGIIPINRGFPEITIDAVSYSTIGSSPIVNGLDPFVVSYSLSRDSYVDVGIWTTASSGTYTAGACENGKCAPYKVKTISENEVKEALTKNTYYWDGLDDQGRYVSAGNYMLRITAQDALFPAKMVTRTIEFPVDMFRVVDVETTPLLELGSSNPLSGLASISYMLSKSMEVTVSIYEQGVVIPTGGGCAWPPVEGTGVCDIHSSTDTAYTPVAIKTFRGTRQGEGYKITDFWDGYRTDNTMATEMMPDGLYPYIIVASASLPGARYYSTDTTDGLIYPLDGSLPAHYLDAMYASDKATGYVTISRGPVYFTEIDIRPTHPIQYYSSATVELAPYEVLFSVNRISSVTVEIISTVPGACMGATSSSGTICRTLTRTNFIGTTLQDYNIYDAGVLNTLYWDGKDENGRYVKIANYQVRFTAWPYLGNSGTGTDEGLNKTVEIRNLVVNNFQVFDRYIWDVAQQNKGQGKFAYQISVPMKTAIQIFKPETRVVDLTTGELHNPIQGSGPVYSTDTRNVLVKAIVGVRPNLVSLEEIWDGTDYAGQKVPDGIYPFRYVTVLDSYQMNSITGDPIVSYSTEPISEIVMDWDKYVNLGVINVVNGDSWYADIDWKDPKVTMFYPNPVVARSGAVANKKIGFFEITKVPAPGTVTIKIYNIAGDLVRDGGYECVNAIGTTATLEEFNTTYGGVTPDWNINGYTNPSPTGIDPNLLGSQALGRNFAMRCKWDLKNNAGNDVARGLYYAIMTLNPTRGNSNKSQRVIKILIP